MNKTKAFATLLLLLASSAALAKGQVDFIHYKARLTPDFPSRSVAGTVEIEFSATADRVRELVFSANTRRFAPWSASGSTCPTVSTKMPWSSPLTGP